MNTSTIALHVLLLVTLLLVGWLVRPFADAVLVAAVVAILAWPFRERVLRSVGGRRLPATVLSLVGVTVGVVVPVALLVWLVSRELGTLAHLLTAEMDKGRVDEVVLSLRDLPLVHRVIEQLGGAEFVAERARTLGRAAMTDLGSTAGQYVPGLLGVTARALLKVIIFFLTLSTLFLRGDELSRRTIRLSPLQATDTRRLIRVFTQFARNVVLAGVSSAFVQVIAATVGYLLAGVERALLFGLLTGVMGFVPVVGTVVAWVPVSLLLLLQGRPGAALFVAVWSVLVTGMVDNLVKPMVVRGNSDIPTLLVFLGVFGGLLAFGLIGLLVGPVLIAMMLALLAIYEETLPGEQAT